MVTIKLYGVVKGVLSCMALSKLCLLHNGPLAYAFCQCPAYYWGMQQRGKAFCLLAIAPPTRAAYFEEGSSLDESGEDQNGVV